MYDFPLSRGLLYSKNDPELEAEFVERSERNDFVQTRGFLFWQTGLANGFNPITTGNYSNDGTLWARLELVFTVGPLVLVELALRGLVYRFPLILAAIIGWQLYRKQNVWFSQQ